MSGKRSKIAQFRVNEEEDAHLRKAAGDASLKLSDYLRSVCMTRSVIVVGEQTVVVIPATTSKTADDQELMERMRVILAGLRGEEVTPAVPGPPSPEPAGMPSQSLPAGAPPASPPATPTSPSEPEGMVGASPSDAAPVSNPAKVAAGAIPGSAKTVIRTRQDEHAPGEFEPGGVAACPHCGGTDGRHQSFCEVVRGEPPVVETEEAPSRAVNGETKEAFLVRRVEEEGQLMVVAEAEWRSIENGSDPPPFDPPSVPAAGRAEPCASCGALKLPEAQCADCGRRPD